MHYRFLGMVIALNECVVLAVQDQAAVQADSDGTEDEEAARVFGTENITSLVGLKGLSLLFQASPDVLW